VVLVAQVQKTTGVMVGKPQEIQESQQALVEQTQAQVVVEKTDHLEVYLALVVQV
jgi:hypothetical protein